MGVKKNGWHPADVVAGLKKNGWSLRKLSEANGLSPTTLGMVQCVQRPRLELIVANALNEKPSSIWPERYNDDETVNRDYNNEK